MLLAVALWRGRASRLGRARSASQILHFAFAVITPNHCSTAPPRAYRAFDVAAAALTREPLVLEAHRDRALVLGSGGLTGIAWEAGVLQGLADGGFPVADWDLVVGSSAGAYVGARLLAEGSAGPVFGAQLSLDARAEERALRAATGRLVIW